MVSSSLELHTHEDPAAAAEPPLFLHGAQRVAQIWDLVVWLHLPAGSTEPDAAAAETRSAAGQHVAPGQGTVEREYISIL